MVDTSTDTDVSLFQQTNKQAIPKDFEWQDVLDIGEECDERFLNWQKVPELEELEIPLCGISNLTGRYRVGRTNPKSHTILYSVDGSVDVVTKQGKFHVEKCQLILLPANAPFLIELNTPYWEMAWFDFIDGPLWRDYFKGRDSVVMCEFGKHIFHALSIVYYECEESLRRPMLSYLMRYLHQTLKTGAGDSPDILRVKQLFRDVEKRLHLNWSVEDMCQIVHYSAPHLHRVCQRVFSRSPLQQVIFMRVERAKHLLNSTSWPVAVVAEQVGYQDVFSFSKRFKKSVGQSPANYRKSCL